MAMWRSEFDMEMRDNYNVPGGLSARQLAERFGVTKGSVIRRARVLELDQPKSGVRRRPARAANRDVIEDRLPEPALPTPYTPILPVVLPPKPAKRTSAAPEFKPVQPSSPWQTCQWIDDHGTPHSHMCGAKTIPGRSWCPYHYAIVFVPARRKDAA